MSFALDGLAEALSHRARRCWDCRCGHVTAAVRPMRFVSRTNHIEHRPDGDVPANTRVAVLPIDTCVHAVTHWGGPLATTIEDVRAQFAE